MYENICLKNMTLCLSQCLFDHEGKVKRCVCGDEEKQVSQRCDENPTGYRSIAVATDTDAGASEGTEMPRASVCWHLSEYHSIAEDTDIAPR